MHRNLGGGEMAKDQEIDRWLIRAKDVIIICGAVATFAAFGLRLYTLPGVVEAQASQIKEQDAKIIVLRDTDGVLDKRITSMETKLEYIADSLKEIKILLRNKQL